MKIKRLESGISILPEREAATIFKATVKGPKNVDVNVYAGFTVVCPDSRIRVLCDVFYTFLPFTFRYDEITSQVKFLGEGERDVGDLFIELLSASRAEVEILIVVAVDGATER